MSTRGAVGWVIGNSWKAVYNHWDSYPTGLGKAVWAEIKRRGVKEVVAGIKQVGDWREFIGGGTCQYCGKKAGQPHTIDSRVSLYKGEGFPDPESRYHQHGKSVKDQFTPERCNPVFIEWVYVIDEVNHLFKIYSSYNTGEKVVEYNFKGESYDSTKYAHRLIAEFDLDGDEPNWVAMENLDKKLNG